MYTDRIHMIYYAKISVLFRAILGRFSKKKIRVSPGPNHHFHSNLEFFEFFLLRKAPKFRKLFNIPYTVQCLLQV